MPLTGKSIAVLGANGFIGTHLCPLLIKNGAHVSAFDRNLSPAVDQCDNRHGDFLKADDVDHAISECDAIVHLIHSTLPISSNKSPLTDASDNIIPSLRLLDLAVKHHIKRIIYVSSGGTVYGKQIQWPILESAPTYPNCAYAISKLAIEHYCSLYHHLYKLDYTVLRVANPYGPFQATHKGNGVITTFIEGYLKNKPLEIWGNGLTVRDYIHVEDVASAIIKSLNYTGPHKCFNIGSGTGKSILNLISVLEEVIGHPIDKTFFENRTPDIPQNVLNTYLAKQELHWSPTIPLHRGIKELINFMKTQVTA
ncbi:MAG: NAD-dependent epimerase/dehydratase family protein [Alphaproteobacteria bacterium]|nr:NAD-dependent epimerase/dehydratase family protein [Alphaproteobacteria bacterium]